MVLSPDHAPFTEAEWQRIDALGQWVESRLQAMGVGLTMGGEPTFVSQDDFESLQWRTAALGVDKRRLASQLLWRLEQRFSQGGSLLHYGLGKLYPGEAFPRWSLGCYWREDHAPIWVNPTLRAEDGKEYGHTQATAERFVGTLIRHLGISSTGLLTAQDRLSGDWAGYVLPLLPITVQGQLRWSTCRWLLPEGQESLQLIPGDSQIGLRLPLTEISWSDCLIKEAVAPLDATPTVTAGPVVDSPPNSIGIALGVEIRGGTLRVFLPPLTSARSFIDLITAIEAATTETAIPILIEGYPPPVNRGICGFQITPDPGVIEVNIHPAETWQDLVAQTHILYAEANHCRLSAEKYSLDGRRISTGGGAHITIGGQTPQTSPLLRRPDLLRSLISYWQNHPSLSYVFAGLFVGPTSQSPRLDEARHETLYALEIAFQALKPGQALAPEVLDSLLGNLLVDASGNAHRTALCIDKLYPAQIPSLQWGLLEFRGFTMPPHPTLRLLQLLLIRALVAWFWQHPYTEPLRRWGTTLHDRFLLPYYLHQDLAAVMADLQQAGYGFELAWFEPFLDFRFPTYGAVSLVDSAGLPLALELRHAIEPWPVIGQAVLSGGTARTVDASMERLQVTVRGEALTETRDYEVVCHQYRIPLMATVTPGEWVGSVRFRARQTTPISHPVLAPHPSLIFDVVDRQTLRSQGGCTYHVQSPQANPYPGFPTHPTEAAARMTERFIPHGPGSEPIAYRDAPSSLEYPSSLDLRRVPILPAQPVQG
jgi:uncharacterized protein (DUF2126 family)